MKVETMKVTLTMTEPILGAVPKDPEVYRTYIASKAPPEVNADGEVATVPIEEVEQKGWTGFHQDAKGLFLYDYAIKGFLKASAIALSGQTDIKNSRSKVDTLVFIFPRRVHILKDGKPVKAPDRVVERPLRAQTAQGPRVALARSDCVEAGCQLKFEVHVVGNKKDISLRLVKELFEFAKYEGLGQFRSGSYGRAVAEFA